MNGIKDPCDHVFKPLGFHVISTTNNKVETVAAVFCEKCSMFRTKVLTFHRENLEDPDHPQSQPE
jgi:hypothetical protein